MERIGVFKMKWYNGILLFTLFGIAMWFFGNLYEAIVIGPNMIHDSMNRLHAWQQFFVLTNPVFFYVPIPQLATLALLGLFIKAPAGSVELKRLLKIANVFQLSSIALSVYIISQINFKLFFGDLSKYTDSVAALALLWNVLNIIRVLLVGVALTFVFKAYLQTQLEKN
jgi:hypothetical protein